MWGSALSLQRLSPSVLPPSIASPLVASTGLLSSWGQDGCHPAKKLAQGGVPSSGFLCEREDAFPRIPLARPPQTSCVSGIQTVSHAHGLLPWSWRRGHLSLGGWGRGSPAFRPNQGPAIKEGKERLSCRRPAVPATSRKQCSSLAVSPAPGCAGAWARSPNGCGTGPNRKLPCGRQKIGRPQ